MPLLDSVLEKPLRKQMTEVFFSKPKLLFYSLVPSPTLIFPRSARFVECETHWRYTRQFAASFGAPTKVESPRIITAVCKVASENDGPQTDCNRTCAAVANNKENGDRYESSSTPTRNLQRLILMTTKILICWHNVRSSNCTISLRENITYRRNYCEIPFKKERKL